jgi:hypothetical protein
MSYSDRAVDGASAGFVGGLVGVACGGGVSCKKLESGFGWGNLSVGLVSGTWLWDGYVSRMAREMLVDLTLSRAKPIMCARIMACM